MTEPSETELYHPGEARTLSEAILDAIEDHTGSDLTREDFVLYESVDPDALDALFRDDADADMYVQFNVRDLTVRLWGDGGIEIAVGDRDEQ